MTSVPENPIYTRNLAYTKSGDHIYNTPLSAEEEQQFRVWIVQNGVPFNVAAEVTDYDMRGFWKALQAGDQKAKSAVDPNDRRLHYPDYWKTPYHATFSAESKWADQAKAPKWNDQDQLVLPNGQVLFDDRAQKAAIVSQKNGANTAAIKAIRTPAIATPQPKAGGTQ